VQKRGFALQPSLAIRIFWDLYHLNDGIMNPQLLTSVEGQGHKARFSPVPFVKEGKKRPRIFRGQGWLFFGLFGFVWLVCLCLFDNYLIEVKIENCPRLYTYFYQNR